MSKLRTYARAIWFSPILLRVGWSICVRSALWGLPCPNFSVMRMLEMPLWRADAIEYVRYLSLVLDQSTEDTLADIQQVEEEESMDA